MNIKPWRTDLKRWLEVPPKVVGDSIYSASRHHQVQALDAKDGTVRWTTDCSDQILEAPYLVGEDTVLVQGRTTEDVGSFVGLDAKTGAVKWNRDFSPRWKYHDIPLQDGPVVVQRSSLTSDKDEPMLMGLSPDTGEPLWSLHSSAKSWGIPVAGSDKRLFLEVRGETESVMAVDGSSGEILWNEPGGIWGQPRPLGDGVLLATREGVTLRQGESGEVSWSHQQALTREPWFTEESVVLAQRRTDGLPGDRLTGLDPETGEVKWNYNTAQLRGVAQGPEGQLLHHAYKMIDGQPNFFLHALDNDTGQGQWSLELGAVEIEDLGTDSEGRVTVATKEFKGRRRELLVVDEGKVLWRRPIEGDGMAVAGNGDSMVVMDRQGMTTVDANTGEFRDRVTTDSPLTNYTAEVSPSGQMVMSGIDGVLVSMTLPGAETVMSPTASTPGRMRHYRYNIAENSDGHYYADVKADGEFYPAEDALLIRDQNVQGAVENPVTQADLETLDADADGYLSRPEMNAAQIKLWWDRNHDGEVSNGDGLVAMAGEGHRQAVVDLDRQKLEVRTRPIGG